MLVCFYVEISTSIEQKRQEKKPRTAGNELRTELLISDDYISITSTFIHFRETIIPQRGGFSRFKETKAVRADLKAICDVYFCRMPKGKESKHVS